MKRNLVAILTMLLAASCSDREKLVDKSMLHGYDYRLFQETPAWNLAKAVWDEDTLTIKKIVAEGKVDIDYQEQRFGNTLLTLAVSNHQYNACKALLQLGADPNKPNNFDGSSSMIEAASAIQDGENTRFLKLLLKYNGDPSYIEVGPRQEGNTTRETPLIASLSVMESSSLPKVKLLVEAGADINYKNEYGQTVLQQAVLLDNYDVVLYLLEKGANYQEVIVDKAKFNEGGKKSFLVDMLRSYLPELHSKEHKTKMAIIDFLRQKGIDYRKVPIQDHIVKEIKNRYPNTWEEYIEKY